MKTSRILLPGLLLIGMSLQAQKIYIRAGLGAAVSTAAEIIGKYTKTSDSTHQTSYEKSGIGSGLPFVIAAGYKLNDNFGFELGVDYFYGFSAKPNSFNGMYSTEEKFHGQMLSLVPAVFVAIPIDKIHAYARLGLKLGVYNTVVGKVHQTSDYTQPADIESTWKDYGGMAIGVQSALGADYALNDNISLFGEIQLDGISYSPKHGKYTEYKENGVDKMGSRSVKENNWDYVDTWPYPNSLPDDQPNEFSKINYLFGNVGLVVGVKYTL
jgi:hypothetical protein